MDTPKEKQLSIRAEILVIRDCRDILAEVLWAHDTVGFEESDDGSQFSVTAFFDAERDPGELKGLLQAEFFKYF